MYLDKCSIQKAIVLLSQIVEEGRKNPDYVLYLNVLNECEEEVGVMMPINYGDPEAEAFVYKTLLELFVRYGELRLVWTEVWNRIYKVVIHLKTVD